MLEKLDQVVSAIQEYKINGSKPVEKVVESTYGAIVTNLNIYEKTKNTKVGPSFWKILSRLAVVVGITVGSIQIGQTVINLLPGKQTEVIKAEAEIVDESDSVSEIADNK